jgi:hypothetical protein
MIDKLRRIWKEAVMVYLHVNTFLMQDANYGERVWIFIFNGALHVSRRVIEHGYIVGIVYESGKIGQVCNEAD